MVPCYGRQSRNSEYVKIRMNSGPSNGRVSTVRLCEADRILTQIMKTKVE